MMAHWAAKSAVLAAACAWAVPVVSASPLWDYVHAPDDVYGWHLVGDPVRNETAGVAFTGYFLNVTSQAWQGENDTDHRIWWHEVFVCVPDELKNTTTAGIYNTGNSNHAWITSLYDIDIQIGLTLCTTGTISAVLFQNPNAPITFAADPEHAARSEDALLAFTWNNMVQTRDPTKNAFFPMVKAVIKAMDAITEFAEKQGNATLENWLVAGASKRGWTAWLAGAMDDRIVAIAPIVMNMLNLTHSLPHMYEAYDGWSFAMAPYVDQNITSWIGTPDLEYLASVIDPLSYKQNLTMPKYLVDTTGDEFFMLDNDHFWWGDLTDIDYLMVQNAEHSLITGLWEVLPAVKAFFNSILHTTPRPSMDWRIAGGDGTITLTVDATVLAPTKVRLWHATTVEGDPRRDFRMVTGNTTTDPCKFIPVHIFGPACINPIIWWDEVVEPTSKTTSPQGHDLWTYTLTQPMPSSGWAGFFGEVEFPGDPAYISTTQVSIIPQTFPYPPCGSGTECPGVLV